MNITPAMCHATKLVTRGCCIRLGPHPVPGTTGPLGPYIHDNGHHARIGIEGIHLDKYGNLVVTHSDWLDGEIAFHVDPREDETLARLRIRSGPSGGGRTTTVIFYDINGKQVRADDPIFTSTANIWYYAESSRAHCLEGAS